MNREIDFTDHKCLICKRFCRNRRALGNHLNRAHNETIQSYVLKHYFNDVVPKCLCGCGKEVTWHTTGYKYRDYVNGHNAAGFQVKQPKFTREQIDRRNKSIKHAFQKKRERRKLASSPAAVKSEGHSYPNISRLYEERTGEPLDVETFQFIDDKHPLITREQLIRINETSIFPDAPGRDFTEQKLLPELMSFFRAYVTMRGWFYPKCDKTLDETLASIRSAEMRDGIVSSLGSAGNAFLKSRFHSFWNVDTGPVRAFWDDKKLGSVLRYRLGLNNSRPYRYTLSDGHDVECHETFDINIKNIRYGFIVQRASVSWFKPSAAFLIWRHILGDLKSPYVWDPSCGFGARMLGFAAGYPTGTYVGNEPAEMTFNDNVSLLGELKDALRFSGRILRQGSEVDLPVDDRSVDAVFTSPPYFDKEKYFNEPTQCWLQHPTLDAWYDGYLMPTFRTAQRVMKDGARCAVNIDVKNRDVIVRAAKDAGLHLIDELQLKIGRDHFGRKAGHDKANVEPILIFAKE